MTSAGNLLLGLTTHGTGLAKGLVLASGTAPSTVPADAVQMWVEDRAGVAGKGSLLMRVEDNTSHVFGDLVGLGRVTPEASLHVEQTTTSGALAAKLETFSNAVTSMGAVVTIKRRTPGDMGDGFLARSSSTRLKTMRPASTSSAGWGGYATAPIIRAS